MYICKICQESPNSHSFDILKEEDDHIIFYSCLAKATKPFDHHGILSHYIGMLTSKKDKNWTWIIDGKNANPKMLDTKIAISLLKLCQTHIDSLKKIIIINPNASMKGILNLTFPFLSKKMQNLITYESNSNEVNLTI